MTKCVFARKFRGFKAVNVPLDRTLFLVGDNSSGKSSILHLINLVCSKELIGPQGLETNHYVDRGDIFSPYFDYADVDVGFYSDDEASRISRVITIKRVKDTFSSYVAKITFSNEHGVLSLRMTSKGKVSGRFYEISTLPTVEDLLSIHDSNRGLRALQLEADGPLNDLNVLVPALVELLADKRPQQNFMNILFARGMPSTRLIAPMRGGPEGFYSFDRQIKPTGSHFATLLSDVSRTEATDIDKAVKKFGLESGLFESLTVSRVSKTVPNSPLTVLVQKNGKSFTLNQVGIGVSQIAPIIAETLAVERGFMPCDIFLVQQPELHLHPRAQAALGEFIYQGAKLQMGFCLETHSDFLIDRFRANMREHKDDIKASVIYCKNDSSGNSASEIKILSDGTLDEPPSDYLDFFVNELARTMV